MMETLPNEMVQYIFRFVDDCAPFRFVCRLWRDLLPGKIRMNYISYLAESEYFEVLKWAREMGLHGMN